MPSRRGFLAAREHRCWGWCCARQGTLFETAYSTTSWTLPAHISLFTSLFDSLHGVTDNGLRLPEGIPTLAQTLQQAGYRTCAVISGPYLHPAFGFDRGFDQYINVMDFFPDASPAAMAYEEGIPVFPTVPTPIEEISTKFMRILHKLDSLPIEQIGEDLQATVRGAKQIANSPEIGKVLKNLNATLRQTRLMVSDLRTSVTPEISAVIEKARQSLANAEQILQADSPLQIRMNSAPLVIMTMWYNLNNKINEKSFSN